MRFILKVPEKLISAIHVVPMAGSQHQEEAQQIYFHKWSITANALMLCLIFIKETLLETVLGLFLLLQTQRWKREGKNTKHDSEIGGAKRKKEKKEKRMEDGVRGE
ncbi:hypothetical protein ATANTOWER_013050 [Ataeniobius toweri]|uniref:Uncharacterized protein n=1 Tax=Ataeniobius toweri TaxID=208326 RepID=A0ABU7BYX5_9TELE|nr:hypothetical protein [Ataeniobius toweri]